jgi:hypothetical protein
MSLGHVSSRAAKKKVLKGVSMAGSAKSLQWDSFVLERVLSVHASNGGYRRIRCRGGSAWSRLSVWIFGLVLIVGLTSAGAARDARTTPHGSVVPISATLCDDMKLHHVLGAEAPVGCERLKLVRFRYIDFEGGFHDDGEIVVMDAAAVRVLRIFTALYNMHFPIAKARLMNNYDGNDDASMADNNTSAFNDREIAGGGSISLHAYGLAIDINPIQNPYAKRSGETLIFSPPSGISNANRLNDRPDKPIRSGMAEAIIDVFARNGFLIWGGYWDDPIDYQHFQVSRSLAEQLARVSPAAARAAFEGHVERYRTCRRSTGRRTASTRSKCVMADSVSGNRGAN